MKAGAREAIGASAARRAWSPRVRWPIVLGVFDFAMILGAVAVNPTLPVALLAVFAIVLPLLLILSGVYPSGKAAEAPGKVPLIIWIVVVAAMAVTTLNVTVLRLEAPPSGLGWLLADTIAAILIGRLLAWPVRNALFRAAAKRKTIIIGSGLAAVLVADQIERHSELGLSVAGFVDHGPRRSVRGRHEPLLGDISELSRIMDSLDVEVVVFAYTQDPTEDMLVALYQVDPRVELLMMPRYFQFVSAGMRVEDLAGMPVLRLNRRELGRGERALKRAEDVVFGGLVALMVLPLVPVIALLIKLDTPGPVFFSHERVGRNGKPFRMYKFRSMSATAEFDQEALARLAEDDPRGLKSKSDSRITRFGSFLRKSSIDELPQIINVLKGEMSLVGPRPAVADEVAAYEEWQKKRLTVSPGITGLWQVSGRSDAAFDERIWLDFRYIDSWSLGLDFGILLKTIPAVLSAKGAY